MITTRINIIRFLLFDFFLKFKFLRSKKIVNTYTGRTSNFLWPLIQSDLQTYVKSLGELSVSNDDVNNEPITHTGQQYAVDDQRRLRFQNINEKLVNKK